MGAHTDLFNLDRDEVRAIRRGLKRLRYEIVKSVLRNDSQGWKPEEGKIDVGRATLRTIAGLLDRLPSVDYPVDIDKEMSS
jgi:hypothetical protein